MICIFPEKLVYRGPHCTMNVLTVACRCMNLWCSLFFYTVWLLFVNLILLFFMSLWYLLNLGILLLLTLFLWPMIVSVAWTGILGSFFLVLHRMGLVFWWQFYWTYSGMEILGIEILLVYEQQRPLDFLMIFFKFFYVL